VGFLGGAWKKGRKRVLVFRVLGNREVGKAQGGGGPRKVLLGLDRGERTAEVRKSSSGAKVGGKRWTATLLLGGGGVGVKGNTNLYILQSPNEKDRLGRM